MGVPGRPEPRFGLATRWRQDAIRCGDGRKCITEIGKCRKGREYKSVERKNEENKVWFLWLSTDEG